MIISAALWGTGVMMWGKAIHHIGLSLGFSLFIGTVILVGSVLPIGISVVKRLRQGATAFSDLNSNSNWYSDRIDGRNF